MANPSGAIGIIIILLMIIGGLLFGLGWGIQDARVSNYEITGFRYDDGVRIDGTIGIENPSKLPVPIEKLSYTLSSDGGSLASGETEGFMLEPGYTETDITFLLTGETVVSALRTTSTDVTVNGSVVFSVPIVEPLRFSDTYSRSEWASGLFDLIGGIV